jgi:hypothetical protein
MPVSSFLAVDPQSLPQLDKMLSSLPDQLADPVVEAVGDYLISSFQIYPPYKHVKRKAAFGKTFFSDKQRRWFFWRFRDEIANDTPPPWGKRTQTFRRGWKKIGKGRSLIIANEVPYGPFLKGPGEQSRLAILEGWQDMNTDTASRKQRINEVAQGALKKALKSLKLSK